MSLSDQNESSRSSCSSLLGIRNLGNTCFISAAIHLLRWIDEFKLYPLYSYHPLELFHRTWIQSERFPSGDERHTPAYQSINDLSMLLSLSNVRGEPGDAHELIHRYLDVIADEFPSFQRVLRSTSTDAWFHGSLMEEGIILWDRDVRRKEDEFHYPYLLIQCFVPVTSIPVEIGDQEEGRKTVMFDLKCIVCHLDYMHYVAITVNADGTAILMINDERVQSYTAWEQVWEHFDSGWRPHIILFKRREEEMMAAAESERKKILCVIPEN